MDLYEELKLMAEAQRVSEAASNFVDEIIKIADEFQKDRNETILKAAASIEFAVRSGDFSEYTVEEK